jgi:regulator of sigma E protease
MDIASPGLLFTIVAFIVGFSFLVFIHEWGHYSIARLFKVRVDTFSIGMGKEIWGRTAKSGTRWRISAIPLGGYVKFFGDASAASNPGDIPEGLSEQDQANCFHFKPLWQRALIVAAGPVVNLVAAVLIVAALAYSNGIRVADPVINTVVEDSAAERAGLIPQDRIISVNGRTVERFGDISNVVVLYPNKSIDLVILRDGQVIQMPVLLGESKKVDRFGNEYSFGYLGVSSTELRDRDLGVFEAVSEGTRMTVNMGKTMFTTLGEIIIGLRSVKELGGPVKIAKTVGEAASLGFENFVWILALLSLNLGIVNLLPIPVLDGGHLMFYAMEAIKGSPLSKKAQEAGFVAGAALMLIFMVLVTLNDLQSLAS